VGGDKEVALVTRWSIQRKLLLCVTLLLLIVGLLAFTGFRGVYSYRQLARTISERARELPLSGELSKALGDMRVTLSRARHVGSLTIDDSSQELDGGVLRHEFHLKLIEVQDILRRYKKQLEAELESDLRLSDRTQERKTMDRIERLLTELARSSNEADWVLDDFKVTSLAMQVDQIYDLASQLPKDLHARMHEFAKEVRVEYRTWIIATWASLVLAVGMLLALLGLSYVWVVAPLRKLIKGSRRIAKSDDFEYRIHLSTNDEFAELAEALNAMTTRFQEIRRDLDAQVQARTREVVRSEQLASVGFLAAGVSHEINNPLASIAWCAESLESRLYDILQDCDAGNEEDPNSEIAILRKYLSRIQSEAFRCKGITDKLLDFSRMGDMQKHETDLGELVESVIDMVRHVGTYREKHLEFRCENRVLAPINAPEIKQVVLNLITNALDSLDPGGTVWVELGVQGNAAELIVRDNGCGMTAEVQQHLFEPFFTRRRDGSGTGLGLSITYRIVNDHGGDIQPHSDGPGKGSRVRVTLPLEATEKTSYEREPEKRLQAA
jgi:two-component system NtrC family sensor kinase